MRLKIKGSVVTEFDQACSSAAAGSLSQSSFRRGRRAALAQDVPAGERDADTQT